MYNRGIPTEFSLEVSAKRMKVLDDYFSLQAHHSTPAREAQAGLTTFLTMAYILFVNPVILGAAITVDGVDIGPQLMTATAIAAATGSLLMGLWARLPFALAPGMGLNAYFAYSVVLGQGIPWQTAFGAVFISGLLFLVISVSGLRRLLINAIPTSLKVAITAGIGCFLAFIGLKNGQLVVDHPVTFVTLGSLRDPNAVLTLLGLILTAVFVARGFRAAILIAMLITALLAMVSGAHVYNGQAFAGFQNGILAAPVWPSDLFGALDLAAALEMGVLGIVCTFLFVDFFDSAGTLIALSDRSGHLDEQGQMEHATAAFSVDAIATSLGALFGTSSTTSYIESAAGIGEGGRSGLTAVTVGLLFLLSLFAWPLISVVPAAATAPALIAVGASMLVSCVRIEWQDMREAMPCLLTILGMPLTFSITDGLSLGMISWTVIQALSGGLRKIHPLMWVISLLLVLRYLFLAEA